jgi:hypothetical protein
VAFFVKNVPKPAGSWKRQLLWSVFKRKLNDDKGSCSFPGITPDELHDHDHVRVFFKIVIISSPGAKPAIQGAAQSPVETIAEWRSRFLAPIKFDTMPISTSSAETCQGFLQLINKSKIRF